MPLQSSISISKQNGNRACACAGYGGTIVIDNCDILLAITVEIPDEQSNGIRPCLIVDTRLKGPVGIAQHDRNRAVVVIGDDQITAAVAIQIRVDYRLWI